VGTELGDLGTLRSFGETSSTAVGIEVDKVRGWIAGQPSLGSLELNILAFFEAVLLVS
jgi:hypothetical protein